MRLVLAILLCTCAYYFAKSQTDGFTIQSITSSLPFDPQWETNIEENNVKQILDQPFRYLGKGAQCYAFVSNDEKYVLKFFRYDHLGPPYLSRLPLLHLSEAKKLERKQRLNKHFTSCKIAYDLLKNETGLLFVHLNKTKKFEKKLTLIDKIGIKHSLDLNNYEFVLQKKADLVYPTLEKYLDTDPSKAKEAITDLLQLIVHRFQKGIFDKDPDLKTNFGFIEGRAVQIDIGRFRIDESVSAEVNRDEIKRITDPFYQWLNQKNSELAQFLNEQIDAL